VLDTFVVGIVVSGAAFFVSWRLRTSEMLSPVEE
jgi:hypothetical protein